MFLSTGAPAWEYCVISTYTAPLSSAARSSSTEDTPDLSQAAPLDSTSQRASGRCPKLAVRLTSLLALHAASLSWTLGTSIGF
ncbi:hypothetical protein F503_02610 [Ophiostoma piceae UAMH 11346]|uniref:Uncharacterized protein n=1 Tax=Ophiostoma piceae (strain UAMH 11346) TaxID=1262450 RepID=S3C161_OPHP1|nr:hypothetical protein F503_02610 [Ophiostoma piceae UAMH 11346]